MIQTLILGCGGHALSLLDVIRSRNDLEIVGILDADEQKHGTTWQGIPILGGDDQLKKTGATAFILGVGGVGNNKPRQQIYRSALAAGLTPISLSHPRAIVSPMAQLGPGVQILAGVIVNPGAVVEENVVINTGSIVEHDCRVGAHSHIATGAVLAGTVTLEPLVHVGAGAVIRQGIRVGSGAVIGAGAVVVKNVSAGSTVIGVPARPMASAKGNRP